jgi:ferredoxin-NADP reductase
MKLYPAAISQIVKETSDTYSFILEIPDGYTWTAGQHALWRFQDYTVSPDEKPGRVFTIASAPADGFLMFTTRIAEPHSDFKDILLNRVKPGGRDARRECPRQLHLPTTRQTAPWSSPAASASRRSARCSRIWPPATTRPKKVTVLYSDDRGEFAYGPFWDEIRTALPNVDLRLISNRDEFTGGVDAYAKAHGSDAEYLIAGSPGMNKAFADTLTGLGVAADRIVTDDFRGY